MSKTFEPSEELKKLQLSIAKLSKASPDMPGGGMDSETEDDDMEEELANIKYALSSLGSYLKYLEEAQYRMSESMYKHNDGHMPKLSAGAMKKLLKVCGMDEDYEVAKKVIYASDSSKAIRATIS